MAKVQNWRIGELANWRIGEFFYRRKKASLVKPKVSTRIAFFIFAEDYSFRQIPAKHFYLSDLPDSHFLRS